MTLYSMQKILTHYAWRCLHKNDSIEMKVYNAMDLQSNVGNQQLVKNYWQLIFVFWSLYVPSACMSITTLCCNSWWENTQINHFCYQHEVFDCSWQPKTSYELSTLCIFSLWAAMNEYNGQVLFYWCQYSTKCGSGEDKRFRSNEWKSRVVLD